MDPEGVPADLDEVVAEVTGSVAEQALAELDGPDRLLYPVRSKVRESVEPILARHAARLADIHNRAQPAGPAPEDGDAIRQLGFQNREDAEGLARDHPKRQAFDAIQRRIRQRGTLTRDGARLEMQDADAERDAALNELASGWREQLNAVTRRCQDVIDQGTVEVTDDHRMQAVMLAQELGQANPRHGLPLVKMAIREAAADPSALGTLAAAMPMLRSLYENENRV